MSICISSAEEVVRSLWNEEMIASSVGLSFRFRADVRRKENHASDRHRSGMPFHVRSISFGFLVSNSKCIPSPSLPVLITRAIFRHFSVRSNSLRFMAAAALPPSSSSAMAARPGGSVNISPASSIHLRSLFPGNRFAAALRLERLLLRCELFDPCVLSDLADTFLLGSRVGPFFDVVDGDRPNALFFRGVSDAN